MVEHMSARDYLWQYQQSKQRVRALEYQLQELTDTYKSPALDRLPGPVGPVHTPAADLAEKRIGIREKIADEEARQMEIQREVAETIARVSDAEACEVLTLRYIGGCSWDEVAGRIHASLATCFRAHERGLAEVEILIN